MTIELAYCVVSTSPDIICTVSLQVLRNEDLLQSSIKLPVKPLDLSRVEHLLFLSGADQWSQLPWTCTASLRVALISKHVSLSVFLRLYYNALFKGARLRDPLCTVCANESWSQKLGMNYLLHSLPGTLTLRKDLFNLRLDETDDLKNFKQSITTKFFSRHVPIITTKWVYCKF